MNQIKNTGPSDMGIINNGLISYIALPQLKGDYLETLKQLGADCCRYVTTPCQAGDPERYKIALKALDSFERGMRRQFGFTHTRAYIPPKLEV